MERTSDISKRLAEFIKTLGKPVSVFEAELGLSNGFVSKTNEKMQKKTRMVIKQAYPQLNLDWLFSGEGEMLIPINEQMNYLKPSDSTMQELFKMFNRIMEINEKNAEANRINAEANNRNALNIERLINILEDKGKLAHVR